MVIYKFFLKTQDSRDRYEYVVNLNSNQENNPRRFFTTEEKEKLRHNLQQKSLCAIKDKHLIQILNTWIEDIEEGYRESSLTLDLPLLIESNIEQLDEQGYQDLPSLLSPEISQIEPKWGMLPPLARIFSN